MQCIMLADDVVRLRDGRALAYAEWGDPSGTPLMFFHGTPGSRLLCPDERLSAERGVRLVTVDRPGYGRSDPQPSRTLAGWPADVLQLADALGLGRFGVAGWSGGGPHALACAAQLPERVERVGVVSGRADAFALPGGLEELGQEDRRLVELGRADADSFREQIEDSGAWLLERRADPKSFYTVDRPEADQRVALRPDVAEQAVVWLPEAARRGLDGYAWDWLALRLPWGFDPADVQAEAHVWHGRLDAQIPVSHAEHVAGRVPHAQLTIWPDEGHWAIFDRWAEILAALA